MEESGQTGSERSRGVSCSSSVVRELKKVAGWVSACQGQQGRVRASSLQATAWTGRTGFIWAVDNCANILPPHHVIAGA